ncbi:MAG: zinc metallopeptidase [Eubacteriaceae bacterium]|jgi:Zn-dependent membrane protease YugP|nr:zinc metallopeptidase [Eubacteriaceae bacterium]
MFFYDWTFILLIPGMILAAFAQAKVKSAYNKYSQVRTQNGLTGTQAARQILDAYGLHHVRVEQVAGELTDHYDPRTKILRLSQGVANNNSIAAVGIAAHETGHALQDASGYAPLRFRNFIVPISNIASTASWPLFLIGLFMGNSNIGMTLMNLGILLFIVAFAFYVITLPVEFNASSRALNVLEQNYIVTSEENRGVQKVLSAAALTYVASMVTALLNLVRLIALRNSRR